MFYVFLVWFCVIVCIVTFEFIGLLFVKTQAPSLNELSGINTLIPQNDVLFYQSGAFWTTFFALGIVAIIAGYLVELYLSPIAYLYRYFQKSYPKAYQKVPADLRELSLVFGVFLISIILTTIAIFILNLTSLILLIYFTNFIFFLGMAILPILRYRSTQEMDRPEKPLQAVIHKISPNFSMQASITIGKVYLKVLLPIFGLFVTLLVPLNFHLIYLKEIEYAILLSGLFLGLVIAWKGYPSTQLNSSAFSKNLKNLLLISIVATCSLLFGANSGNILVLFMMSNLSGFLVGNY